MISSSDSFDRLSDRGFAPSGFTGTRVRSDLSMRRDLTFRLLPSRLWAKFLDQSRARVVIVRDCVKPRSESRAFAVLLASQRIAGKIPEKSKRFFRLPFRAVPAVLRNDDT
ncbi:hypothetical protein [Methylorubrum thiocyanatum]